MRKQPWVKGLTLLALGGAVWLLASCDQGPVQVTEVAGAPEGTPGSPGEPSGPQATASPGQATLQAPTTITLTVWAPEIFSPTQAVSGEPGQILAQQVAVFEETRPNVHVHFVRKAESGAAGVRAYLLNTAPVVPGLLPDVALVAMDELEDIVRAELAKPLDALVPGDLVSDLYPFARESCTIDGRLYGLPMLADLDHVVYNTREISLVPRAMPGVLNMDRQYLFPAGGREGLVNDAFLILYLTARNLPAVAVSREPLLEPNSLEAVLQFYLDGQQEGVFPPQFVGIRSTEDCLPPYQAGEVAMTQISAHRYLMVRDRLLSSAVSEVPASKGAIGRGWALVIVTPDPVRQAIAAEFMVQVMDPPVHAAWNMAAAYLPTRQSALDYWDPADPYTPFIAGQLELARPRPRLPNYKQIAGALQEMLEAVLQEEQTPAEAAARIIESNP